MQPACRHSTDDHLRPEQQSIASRCRRAQVLPVAGPDMQQRVDPTSHSTFQAPGTKSKQAHSPGRCATLGTPQNSPTSTCHISTPRTVMHLRQAPPAVSRPPWVVVKVFMRVYACVHVSQQHPKKAQPVQVSSQYHVVCLFTAKQLSALDACKGCRPVCNNPASTTVSGCTNSSIAGLATQQQETPLKTHKPPPAVASAACGCDPCRPSCQVVGMGAILLQVLPTPGSLPPLTRR